MSHWSKYPSIKQFLGPPLRPNEEVVEALQRRSAGHPGRALLLGVTRSYAECFTDLHAVDRNAAMIAEHWVGDSDNRRATLGDWFDIAPADGPYAAVAGDLSLNMCESLERLARLLALTYDVLADGGLFFGRYFERPAVAFTEADIEAAARGERGLNFHAFKIMIAMHLAESRGASVPVIETFGWFNANFPNRQALAESSGWPLEVINTIDTYDGSALVYVLPSRAEICAALPAGTRPEFHASGTYPMADRFPIVTYVK